MKKTLIFFLLLAFFTSCASTQKNRDAQKQLKEFRQQGKFEEAIKLVKSDAYYPEKHSVLLKKLELGSLYYLSGQYYQALKTLDEAKIISDDLYTVRLSKKLTAALSNPNEDHFYGEKYERSSIRFYLALLHFKLYQQGHYEAYELVEGEGKKQKVKKIEKVDLDMPKRRQHLFSARAMILEWDSILSTYVDEEAGENTYKTDLLAKIFGAMIHEEIGTITDRNIARQIYLDSKEILFKYYNLYPTFNHKYLEFSKKFEDFPKMNRKKIEKDFIDPSVYTKELLSFIDKRLNDLKKGNQDNLKIILQDDYIAQKQAKRIDFPLPVAQLGPVSGQNSDLLTFTFELLAISYGTRPTISYELPAVEIKSQSKDYFVIVYDQENKEIQRHKIVIINPFSDIAWQTMDAKIGALNTSVGARVAAKHIAAILASYKIYKSQPNAFGKVTAGLAYAAANKVIAASELVDLRYWSGLPHNVRVASLKLPSLNKYKIAIVSAVGEQQQTLISKEIEVAKDSTMVLDFTLP